MKKAFTLIELLVVIAIIAILAAMLFPVYAQAKTSAKQTQNLSQLKQLAVAAQMYAGDHDDHLPSDPLQNFCPSNPSMSFGSIDRWGNYYWPWLFKPYTKVQPTDVTKFRDAFMWNPNAPQTNPQELSSRRAGCIWPQPAQSWGLECATFNSYCRSIKYWSTYAYNEHIGDFPGASSLTAWQEPAASFLLLEATDSEIEGDELDELYSRTQNCPNFDDPNNRDATFGGHNAGTTIAYLDGHAKWRKTQFGPDGQCSLAWGNVPFMTFPPATQGGDNVRVKGWTPIFDN